MGDLKLKIEFIWLFLILPVSFLFDYPVVLKSIFTVVSFSFVFVYLWKNKAFNFKVSLHFWKSFMKTITVRFFIIAFIVTIFTYVYYNELFFKVLLVNPKLWVLILFVYCFFSVTFQELIYRTFFFKRYQVLFPNKKMLIIVNALVFSLAHIFLKSSLVLILTFVGGILFSLTYFKTKSTTLVCIEHAIYGFWLFTVGLGQLLAFPGAEVEL